MYGGWFSWGVVSDWGGTFLSLLLTGLVVKCMDDTLDMEYDFFLGKKTLANRLGRAALPYALLLLGLAVYLRPGISLGLFLASYVIGMGHDLYVKMPTQLNGWMESGIVCLIMLTLLGVRMTFWSICIISVIQLLDDITDMRKDATTGQRNYAVRFGVVEVTFVLLILFAIAVLEEPNLSVLVLVSVPVVQWLMTILERRWRRV
jgi:1,4-dihydroxy-2-naphthoate octaprenyltransferase